MFDTAHRAHRHGHETRSGSASPASSHCDAAHPRRARAIALSHGERRAWSDTVFAIVSAFVVLAFAIAILTTNAAAQNVRPPANAVENATPGGGGSVQTVPSEGGNYDTRMWEKVRRNVQGHVSIPDAKAGIMVDSSGETWRNFRMGELPRWGAIAILGMVGLLAVFYLARGRVEIEHGRAGWTVERFSDLERMAHWLLAVSFIILALTGLNLIYGRDLLMPLIGKDAFASLSGAGKWMHNYVGFAFMAGLVLTFVIWVWNNIPTPRDVRWFAAGGGLFGGDPPEAAKFNGGQKVLFWIVILAGASVSLSGLQLLFPYDLPLFAKTFAFLNGFGFDLPTDLTPNQEQQFAASWHAIVALFMTVVVIAHIYIGTIGMEGAFDAMGSGEVDANWAKEHHSLWAEEVIERERIIPRREPTAAAGAPPKPLPAE